jgi:hypothetical protein
MRPTAFGSATAGAVAEDPGDFVMSSPSRDLSSMKEQQSATGRHVVAAVHPRRSGFRVLSRMARGRADEDGDYAPRHRLDEPDGAESL